MGLPSTQQLFLPYGIAADGNGGSCIVGCGVQNISPDGVNYYRQPNAF
jgi:hypothetical protein